MMYWSCLGPLGKVKNTQAIIRTPALSFFHILHHAPLPKLSVIVEGISDLLDCRFETSEQESFHKKHLLPCTSILSFDIITRHGPFGPTAQPPLACLCASDESRRAFLFVSDTCIFFPLHNKEKNV